MLLLWNNSGQKDLFASFLSSNSCCWLCIVNFRWSYRFPRRYKKKVLKLISLPCLTTASCRCQHMSVAPFGAFIMDFWQLLRSCSRLAITARKRSCGRWLWFCSQGGGGCLVRGVPASGGRCPVLGGACSRGVWSRGVCSGGGGVWSLGGAWWRPPRTATAAGGTHPTGMHSCYVMKTLFSLSLKVI